MAGAFEVNLVGFRKMLRDLDNVERREGRKIVRRAIRNGAKLARSAMVRRVKQISPGRYGTGRLAAAVSSQLKVRAGKRSRVRIASVIHMPPREKLGIDPKDKHYYPAALEYGHPAPGRQHAAPRSWFRAGYDQVEKEAAAQIEKEIVDGLTKFLRKAT